ncbi:S1/P1 nuclease [Pseudoduganella flava]|uniref:Phospholipase n=1 Tax=Pseudoduganella flava TaxID=871742 RepID=A0A562Q3K0_9BURK|nr:S1/P1 nuclease [Pseudoduganella flava]QGZ41348.1 phospholipase [Pseudoduganella flava]TWI51294.1 S1/P1 nuclease [Pseudoduganella flava]
MKRLACIAALAGAFAAILPGGAQAWGNDGHKAVGAIADKLLKGSKAEQRVKALLLPGESLESIAVWADCVKGTWCGPQTPEMAAYVAANPQHSVYHYTDVPFQLSAYHDHAAGTADDDIVQTLKAAILVLQGKDTPQSNPHKFTPRQALLIVTHLAGDIVQPLHVGAAFVSKDGRFVVPKTPAEIDELNVFDSRGGNNLLLDDAMLVATSGKLIPAGEPKPAQESPPKTKPFHSYWDTTVVDYAMRRSSTRTPQQFAQYAIASNPNVPVSTGDVTTWPYQWANDSLAIAKLAHLDVKLGAVSTLQSKSTGESYKVWALTVPDDYPVPSSALARQQLIKGGYNLAALLKEIWPDA